MIDNEIQYKVLKSFDETAISTLQWNDLLAIGPTDVVFLTWQWQQTWWKVFGRGELLLIIAEKEEKCIAIAPLFSEYGMIYFVGSGGSDYLDFIGKVHDCKILEGLLLFAVQQINNFIGFQFYHIPDESSSNQLLQQIAKNQNWQIIKEGGWGAPRLELNLYPDISAAVTRKKSLLRHEAFFKKNGNLKIEHLHSYEEIKTHLETFFDQHIKRWAQTRFPSLYLDDKQKLFFKEIVASKDIDWLRFTCIIWNEEIVAYHFGINYKGSFLWYKPTFQIQLAKHSPGEVLLRQLLLQAQKEGCHTFDFGLGDEAFKDRFATSKKTVNNWGLYKTVSKKILVISPHPDDESIGCGGTIRKHIVEGDTVEVIFLTSGEHGGSGKALERETINIREIESKKAASILEISHIHFWREPDGKLQVTDKIIQKLMSKVLEFQPSIIYMPHENEEHTDHKAAAEIVKKVLDLLSSYNTIKPLVLMYEVWTPIQKFEHVVDISPYVDLKRNAIAAYESQCSMVRFHEAILGLNRYRGEMHSWPGGDYAEIFKKLEV